MTLLQSLGRQGSICCIRVISGRFWNDSPTRFLLVSRELNAVIERLWDLYQVVKEHYYHPAFEGSYSIKSVLRRSCLRLDTTILSSKMEAVPLMSTIGWCLKRPTGSRKNVLLSHSYTIVRVIPKR